MGPVSRFLAPTKSSPGPGTSFASPNPFAREHQEMSFMNMSCAKIAILAIAAASLAACTATSTQKTAGEQVDDSVLTGKVKAALVADPATKARQIDVETFRGTVQLNGFVDSQEGKDAATRVARSVDGVQKVENNLSVQESSRTAGEAVDDSVLTAKVKAALIADPKVKAHE